MSINPEIAHSRALGARILSEANDLKRTPDSLADELGFERDLIRKVIAGETDVETGHTVVRRMVETYPIRLADLWVEPDDTDDGVIVMRANESKSGARVFERKGRGGELSSYYEYRDTAMSRLGPFKPEWIQPIRIVSDDNPTDPDVAYNNGHLMHQMTFFIGAVNFYWESGGEKHCMEMRTGDSNYITPFVPHSFTSRTPGAPGLIIAVTFAGAVRRALDDFAVLGARDAESLAGDLRQDDAAFSTRLERYLANESLDRATLRRQLSGAGLKRAADIADGRVTPEPEELEVLATVLNVRPQDLLTTAMTWDEDVVLLQADEGQWRPWPSSNAASIRVNTLVRTRHQPGLKGFHVEAISDIDQGSDADMRHGLFEYVYNYGDHPIRLQWGTDRETEIQPGDSATVRPMVPHRFSLPLGAREPARFFLVRVPGQLDDATLDEYARFAPEGRNRVAKETKRWF